MAFQKIELQRFDKPLELHVNYMSMTFPKKFKTF